VHEWTAVLDSLRAKQLELDDVAACAACLFELAWRIHEGERLHWQTVAATARVVWPEMGPTLELAVVDARMREVHDAEVALRELRGRGPNGRVARAVVLRLAEEMAAEILSDRGPSATAIELHIRQHY
jgi:hypothetical protein